MFIRRFGIQANEMAIDYSVVTIEGRHKIGLEIWMNLIGF